MFKIIWRNYKEFWIQDPRNRKAFVGYDERELVIILREMRIDYIQIELLLFELLVNKHNYAEFGLNGTLVFSKYLSEWDVNSSEHIWNLSSKAS